MEAHMIRCVIHYLAIFLVIFTISTQGVTDSTKRRISEIQFNPGCNVTACSNGTNGSFANIIHIEASGANDSLHYIISTIGNPVILIAKTVAPHVGLHIDWEKFLHGSDIADSIKFNTTITYSMGMVITGLLEYNDTTDDADLTKLKSSAPTKWHDLSHLKFELINKQNNSNITNHTVVFKASSQLNPEKFIKNKNGSLNFKVSVFDKDIRSDRLPRLEASGNMSQFDFELDNFASTWNGSRFALEMVLFMTGKDDTTKIEKLNSIDDEHSPGVFQIINWRKKKAGTDEYSGFMQWKPVCYLDHARTRSTGTRAKDYGLLSEGKDVIKNKTMKNNIAYAFFGQKLENMIMNATNVSFGLKQDKFYPGHNYTVWTASVGYGIVPTDGLSLLVIVIIIAGLGIPFLLMVAGGIFVVIRARRMQSGYQAIN